jgi:hypothetical protein
MLVANNAPANADCGPVSADQLDLIFMGMSGTIVLSAALPTITENMLISGHGAATRSTVTAVCVLL